jgi:protein FrlC
MAECRIAACNAQYIRRPFSEFVETQRRLGIRQMEFVAQVPHLWCDHVVCEDESRVASLIREADIGIAAFTPRIYRYSICARPKSQQARSTISYFSNTIKIAARLRSPIFCVESGGGQFDVPADELWKRAGEMLSIICAMTEKEGILLAVGAASKTDSPVLTTLSELARMKNEIGHKNFKVILDTQMASIAGETIPEWFDRFGDDIALVRFVDGNYNGYRPWGEGCLPCGKFAEQIVRSGYKGVLSQYRKGEFDVSCPIEADMRNYRYLVERVNVRGDY